jgi:hypothetical protein
MRYSNQGRFRQQVSFLRRQFLQDGDLPFSNVLSEESITQALTAIGVCWLDRIYPPLVTLWVFLGQVLSADHSCRAAASSTHQAPPFAGRGNAAERRSITGWVSPGGYGRIEEMTAAAEKQNPALRRLTLKFESAAVAERTARRYVSLRLTLKFESVAVILLLGRINRHKTTLLGSVGKCREVRKPYNCSGFWRFRVLSGCPKIISLTVCHHYRS